MKPVRFLKKRAAIYHKQGKAVDKRKVFLETQASDAHEGMKHVLYRAEVSHLLKKMHWFYQTFVHVVVSQVLKILVSGLTR